MGSKALIRVHVRRHMGSKAPFRVNGSSIASRIISDTVEAGYIKPSDVETASKKYMTYIPYYG